MPVQTVIKLRRDTAANWDLTNPVLAAGEQGYESDTGLVKIGDGAAAWGALPYSATSRLVQTVKNDSGSAMVKGAVVYISGANGGDALVSLADADTEATSSKTVGVLTEAIANGGYGEVIAEGLIAGVNTSTATAGQSVWLSGTAGQFVFGAPPAKPAHSVYLGVVVRVHATEGEILVKVQNGYELNELHDVNAGSPSDNNVLAWDSASSMWTNQTVSEIGAATASHTHTLNDLSDVFAAAPTTGDVLYYDLGGDGWNSVPIANLVPNATPSVTGKVHGNTDGTVGYQVTALGNGAAGASTGNMDSVVAIGANAMGASLWGNYTVAVGHGAMAVGEPGGESVAIGYDALSNDSSSGNNTAVGAAAMYNFTTGAENVAVGHQALNDPTTVSQSVAVGVNAGGTGSASVFLGYRAGSNSTGSNVLYIANSNTTTPLIYGEFDNAKVSINGSLKFTEAAREKVYTTATGFAGYTYYTQTNGAIQYITANSTANGTVNIRPSSTLTMNNWLAVGESTTIVLQITNGATAYYPNAWQIDGSAVTPKWLGGTAPAAGNANAIDTYTMTITKTGAATYTVFGAVSKFA